MKWTLCALFVVAGCTHGNGASDDLAAVGGNGASPLDMAMTTEAPDLTVVSDDLAASAPDLTVVSDLSAQMPPDLTRVPADLERPPVDLAQSPHDLARPPLDLAHAPPDLWRPPVDLAQSPTDVTVHILIDNFCNSSTNPAVINAPLHVPLDLTFENDSHDYDSDVWSSRGYGYLGLVQGGVWHDPIQHCLNPVAYTEYFDVGIAGGPVGGSCPNYRLEIHCN